MRYRVRCYSALRLSNYKRMHVCMYDNGRVAYRPIHGPSRFAWLASAEAQRAHRVNWPGPFVMMTQKRRLANAIFFITDRPERYL